MSIMFGNHLRELRKKNGYTQQQIADILNICRSTYTYYETGKSEPGLYKINMMCEIFEIDYNGIMDY